MRFWKIFIEECVYHEKNCFDFISDYGNGSLYFGLLEKL